MRVKRNWMGLETRPSRDRRAAALAREWRRLVALHGVAGARNVCAYRRLERTTAAQATLAQKIGVLARRVRAALLAPWRRAA